VAGYEDVHGEVQGEEGHGGDDSHAVVQETLDSLRVRVSHEVLKGLGARESQLRLVGKDQGGRGRGA